MDIWREGSQAGGYGDEGISVRDNGQLHCFWGVCGHEEGR